MKVVDPVHHLVNHKRESAHLYLQATLVRFRLQRKQTTCLTDPLFPGLVRSFDTASLTYLRTS